MRGYITLFCINGTAGTVCYTEKLGVHSSGVSYVLPSVRTIGSVHYTVGVRYSGVSAKRGFTVLYYYYESRNMYLDR